MSNFLLAYDNQADGATLSAGSWNASLPLDNLKNYVTSKKARSTNALAASTKLRFALAAAVDIGAVGLVATNASLAATYRLQLFSDSGFTVQIYDSGTVDVYPTGSLGAGKPTLAEAQRWQQNIFHILSASTSARYGELQITDTANTDGYFEAGRLFVGLKFQPTRNAAYGRAALRLTSRTGMVEAEDGTPYFNTRRPRFSIPFSLDWLTEAEAMVLLDMQALVDVHGEVLAMWDPGDIEYAYKRQVFGRLAQLDPIEHPLFATYATAFQVEGVL